MTVTALHLLAFGGPIPPFTESSTLKTTIIEIMHIQIKNKCWIVLIESSKKKFQQPKDLHNMFLLFAVFM